ncbi:MAG: right-handed parallel beta-helix repeat-containing protein [bacterium]
MRKFLTFLAMLISVHAAFGDVRLIMVDGFCYLEGQSEHSETKVKFIKVSPSAVTDSTYTDSSGYFFLSGLYEGIYDVEYTHADFDTVVIEDQILVGSTTLPPVTLNSLFVTVDGYCYLEGQGEHSDTKVKFIKVSPAGATHSTYTDSSGYFIMNGLYKGTYNVEYSHVCFDTVLLENQAFVSSTTLSPVTLVRLPCELAGHLQGVLGPNTFHVIDTIWVDSGDSLTLVPGTVFVFDGPYPFMIYGSLLAEGTESDSIVFTTEQSGENRWRGLRFSYPTSSGSRLAYCLVEKGYATGSYPNECGGGIYCSNSSPTFVNCVVRDNSAGNTGGGVRCESSSPSLSNCTISGNSAGYSGGGVSCYSSSPSLTNCVVSNNSAGNTGGGVRCNNSSAVFTNCIISDNTAANMGGGVSCTDSSPTFTSCTISGNSGYDQGGGLYCDNSLPTLTHCTISGNSAGTPGAGNGGGVCCVSSSPTMNGTIIAFSDGSGIYFRNSAGSQINYCDISRNTGGNITFYNNDPSQGPPGIWQFVTGNANGDSCDVYFNICVDPMFADTTTGDFHLLDNSHCIGAGDPAIAGTDFEGDPRPNPPSSFPDIGVDENPNAHPPCELSGSLQGTLGPGACHIVGTISLNSGDSLILLPGTAFIFDGPYPFRIYGTLLAEGTESDSIIFTTDTLLNPVRWRGLRFEGAASSGSRLTYCLVERGSDASGVGCSSSSPSLTNCTVSGNSGMDGGGVYCVYSSPIFTNCILSDNSVIGNGGGIVCSDNSSPTFANCTVSGNSAGYFGSGIYCQYSSPTFTNCMLDENSAGHDGGGVYCYYSSATLTNCRISRNTASDGNGGGLYCEASSPAFVGCTIRENQAWNGGGMFCNNSSPNFTNCTVNSNSVYNVGGGMYCVGSSPTFTTCTLSGNSAGSGGGGIRCYQSLPTLSSTIIAFSTGAGIYFYNSASSQISYCDIFGNSEGNIVFNNNDPSQGPPMIGVPLVMNANADSADIYLNIFVDPMFADTATGDFHLTDFSHCIGAGDPAGIVSTDFEGDPRPNPSWSYPDIGADEHWSGSPVLHLRVLVVSGNARLHWTPFGAGPYYIYGATEPFMAGTLLATVSDTTTWTDEATASRPSRYFYYVMAEWPGR